MKSQQALQGWVMGTMIPGTCGLKKSLNVTSTKYKNVYGENIIPCGVAVCEEIGFNSHARKCFVRRLYYKCAWGAATKASFRIAKNTVNSLKWVKSN